MLADEQLSIAVRDQKFSKLSAELPLGISSILACSSIQWTSSWITGRVRVARVSAIDSRKPIYRPIGTASGCP